MSLADRLKMFEKAASDTAGTGRPGGAPAKRPVWGAARGPSLAEQIQKVCSTARGVSPCLPFVCAVCGLAFF